jgi:hypothetical protein
MAAPDSTLIRMLRESASRLSVTSSYQWGHMGMCNCGHLVQTLTGLTASEIHSSAMQRHGDWEAQADDYCPTSGLLIDHILAAMMELGLDRNDIRNLEKLSDPAVLLRLPRHVRHNVRDDVVLYMRGWADLLEEQLAGQDQLALADAHADVIDDFVDGVDDSLTRELIGKGPS